jgi:hypothetical protein
MPSPCTVSGTLQTLCSGHIAQGTVIFQLSNFGSNLPRVLGTSILPGTQFSAMTDQTGNFSINLWGNDNIDPAGTLYLVTFRDYLKNEIGPIPFNITGLTFNLNTAVHS